MGKLWHQISIDEQIVDVGSRLESIRYTDKRGLEADDVEIVIIDHDGAVELPRTGVNLTVSFGEDDQAVSALVVVDEVAQDICPDKITIRGRAANLRAGFLSMRSESYHATTLGQVLEAVSARQGAELKCSEVLAGIPIEHIDQQSESDANFITRLAGDYDAIASVKQGYLIFAPVGQAQSVSGDPLEPVLIDLTDIESANYRDTDRSGEVSGVEGKWQDTKEAEEKTALAGEAGNLRSLKRTFATEAEAQAAAEAEFARLKRCTRTLSLNLKRLFAEVLAEVPLSLTGFKPQIGEVSWVVTEATHEYGRSGCKTTVQSEQV